MATNEQTPKATRSKVIDVSADLHAQLRMKAAKEGRPMKVIVEEKLKELFADAQKAALN